MSPEVSQHGSYLRATKHWIERVVIALNLCPFAKREWLAERIEYRMTEARTETQLLSELERALLSLQSHHRVETCFIIHPHVLNDFDAYNQFLNRADALLVALEMEGIFQIASFHPDYQFYGTRVSDAQNYSNRSPYPMLHLLREASIERALLDYPAADNISDTNIRVLEKLGSAQLQDLLEHCLHNADKPES